jgi:glycosyltransferase involved in cell wall biosynthesis
MAKILIVGHPTSPLEQTRGLVGQRAGHQIFWFSVPPATLPGVTSLSVPNFARQSAPTRFLLKPLFLSLAIQKARPDIVHIHYAQTGLMTLPLARFHPLVVTVMGGDILPDQGYRSLAAISTRWLLEHADCITSKTEFMDSALDKIGNYRNKIRRITWGIDLNHFHPGRNVAALRVRWSIPPHDLVVFDSRLARPFYNKHIIMEAFAGYLQSGGPSATLLVAEAFADPAYLVRLRQQAQRLGIPDRVRFVGAIPYAEMPDYYALSDITVSVPPSDGLPQTIYEAYACGSFLIVGALPQYAEVVEDQVTALQVPVGSVQALKKAISWICANPDVRERAKSIGRAYVQKHADFDKQANFMNQIYADLLCKP